MCREVEEVALVSRTPEPPSTDAARCTSQRDASVLALLLLLLLLRRQLRQRQ